MKLVVLSFNDYQGYFRKGFCEAAENAGTPTLFVDWKNRVDLLRKGETEAIFPADVPIFELARQIREFARGDRTCVINSMAFHRVPEALWLRKRLREAIWVYDVFDYFFYDSKGKRLLIAKVKDWLNRKMSDKIMVLSKNLLEVYPGAFHLDNASHARPRARGNKPRKSAAAIASFDDRFDFDLMGELAGYLPDFDFRLHGWIKNDNAKTRDAMARLTAGHPNVAYRGPYLNCRLDRLLDDCDIGLLPYAENSVLTRYVNPDKLYHYLCAGMEVVATPIPQARAMAGHVHLAANAREFADRLRSIVESGDTLNDGSFHATNNWETRWLEFMSFVGK